MAVQHVANQAANATVADHHDIRRPRLFRPRDRSIPGIKLRRRFRHPCYGRRIAATDPGSETGQKGNREHRQGGGHQQGLADLRAHDPGLHGAVQDNEGELAAGRQQKSRFEGRAPFEPERQPKSENHPAGQGHKPQGHADDRARMGEQPGQVQIDADRDEEQPEQKPLEGLDGPFHLMPVLGLGQQ